MNEAATLQTGFISMLDQLDRGLTPILTDAVRKSGNCWEIWNSPGNKQGKFLTSVYRRGKDSRATRPRVAEKLVSVSSSTGPREVDRNSGLISIVGYVVYYYLLSIKYHVMHLCTKNMG